MIISMREILRQAAESNYIIPGFNVFSYDWAMKVVEAAEEVNKTVIIMTNRAVVAKYGLEYLGSSLSDLAKKATVDVCVHLDHTSSFNDIFKAIASGYSSVMFDGSSMDLEQNIEMTKMMADFAHACNVSIEGEVGSVAYTDQPDTITEFTDPVEAAVFAKKTGVDAMAVSVGTVHRMVTSEARIDHGRLQEIENATKTPLVIHGASGLSDSEMIRLLKTRVAKINIGTSLRLAYTSALRSVLENNHEVFDKLELMEKPYDAVKLAALEKFAILNKELN